MIETERLILRQVLKTRKLGDCRHWVK